MTYAIRLEEIRHNTFLVDADSLDEAISIVEEAYEANELDLDFGDECEINTLASPYAKPNGEATEYQLKYCERLEV